MVAFFCRFVAGTGAVGGSLRRRRPFLATDVRTGLSCVEIGQPAQGSQPGHETVLTTPHDDEPRQALQASADRPAWDGEAVGTIVRSDNRVPRIARPAEDAAVDPLRLDALKLPPQVRADGGAHNLPMGPVARQDTYAQ